MIDIYAEAGLAIPDISPIDDDFAKKMRHSSRPALQMETLKRMLGTEIRRIAKKNIVFSEMLSDTLLRYQIRTLDTAQVIAELAAGRAAQGRGPRAVTGRVGVLRRHRTNDSAVLELGDEQLKKVAHELLAIVRRDAKTDLHVKEQVRARLRFTIKMLLERYTF